MPKKSPFHAELRKAAWISPTVFKVLAWVYPTGKNIGDWSIYDAWLEDEKGQRFGLAVTQVPDALANEKNKLSHVDASMGALQASIDFQDISRQSGAGRRLTLKAAVTAGDLQHEVTLSQRYRWGSARTLCASDPINNKMVVPGWNDQGLTFSIRKPAVSCATLRATALGFNLGLDLDGDFAPTTLELVTEQGDLIVSSAISAEKPTAKLRLGPRSRQKLRTGVARLYATDGDKRRLVHINSKVLEGGADRSLLGRQFHVSRGPAGVLRLERTPAGELLVERVETQNDNSPLIRLECSRDGSQKGVPIRAELVGNRSNVSGRVADATADSFTLEFRLMRRSKGRSSTLTSGGYRVRLWTADGKQTYLKVSDQLQRSLYASHAGPLMNLRVESTPQDEFYLHADTPKAPDEIGAYNQALLAEQSRMRSEISPNDFYLESWFGKSVSDNQLPLVRQIQTTRPGANIWVGVIDYSVEVPTGTRPSIIGTRQWWKVLHSSKYVISNSWFPNGFIKQAGQVVVQTWHGTPLKFLGLDRPDSAGRPGRAEKLAADSNQWDLLVSQNTHSSTSFRSAYRYNGEIAEVGYPRNDDLVDASTDERRRIRHELGLADEETVILYAPTWRESDKSASDFLDVGVLSQKLGTGHRILLRGHSVTLRRGSNVDIPGVLDVTGHPSATQLMIAADALVTDYSSIMFDFTVTGKPVVFFTPDYDDYTSGGRGVYFDLRPQAPGPLSTTQDELVGHLHTLDRVMGTYADAYDSWQKRFNAWDDGKSSEKLLRRILEIGEGRVLGQPHSSRDEPAK